MLEPWGRGSPLPSLSSPCLYTRLPCLLWAGPLLGPFCRKAFLSVHSIALGRGLTFFRSPGDREGYPRGSTLSNVYLLI